MKNQILALMACAAILTPTAGFCMENERDFKIPTTKKVNLNIIYKSDCSTGAAPSHIQEACISYTCGEMSGCLGHYFDVGQNVTASQQREVNLPCEGDTVKFSFFCKLKAKIKDQYQESEFDIFNGDFYDGAAAYESNIWISEIQQSSILDGSKLELELKAAGVQRTKKGYYLTPAYDLIPRLWTSKPPVQQ